MKPIILLVLLLVCSTIANNVRKVEKKHMVSFSQLKEIINHGQHQLTVQTADQVYEAKEAIEVQTSQKVEQPDQINEQDVQVEDTQAISEQLVQPEVQEEVQEVQTEIKNVESEQQIQGQVQDINLDGNQVQMETVQIPSNDQTDAQEQVQDQQVERAQTQTQNNQEQSVEQNVQANNDNNEKIQVFDLDLNADDDQQVQETQDQQENENIDYQDELQYIQQESLELSQEQQVTQDEQLKDQEDAQLLGIAQEDEKVSITDSIKQLLNQELKQFGDVVETQDHQKVLVPNSFLQLSNSKGSRKYDRQSDGVMFEENHVVVHIQRAVNVAEPNLSFIQTSQFQLDDGFSHVPE